MAKPIDLKWNETSLQDELKQRVPDFPKGETLREARVQIAPGKTGNSAFEDFGCVGFKLHSNDNFHIVPFNKG
jgi:hypothetical protein